MIVELDSSNFEAQIKEGLRVVVFSAKWCSYCQKQNIVLQELNDIWIGKVDGDASPDLASEYGVMGFPTFVIFKDGKLINKFSGYRDKSELMHILMKFV